MSAISHARTLFGDLPCKAYDPKKSTMRKHMWRASAQQAEYWVGFEALKRRRERATSMWFKFCFGEHL